MVQTAGSQQEALKIIRVTGDSRLPLSVSEWYMCVCVRVCEFCGGLVTCPDLSPNECWDRLQPTVLSQPSLDWNLGRKLEPLAQVDPPPLL